MAPEITSRKEGYAVRRRREEIKAQISITRISLLRQNQGLTSAPLTHLNEILSSSVGNESEGRLVQEPVDGREEHTQSPKARANEIEAVRKHEKESQARLAHEVGNLLKPVLGEQAKSEQAVSYFRSVRRAQHQLDADQ
jgi:hypothetical protein